MYDGPKHAMLDEAPEGSPGMRGSGCPACGATSFRILREVTSDEAAQNFVTRQADSERHRALRENIRTLWGGDRCRVCRCTGCGFVFADPYVAGGAEFYELASPNTPYPVWKWEFQQTLDLLERTRLRRGAAPGSLIEIGAGCGAFLKALVGAGWPRDRLMATEFSQSGLRALRELGVPCVEQDVRTLAAAPFDVICLFQVLEHLDDLPGLLDALNRLAAPGADIVMAVPNGPMVEATEAAGLLPDMPPNHIGRWDEEPLRALCGRAGWTLMDLRREPVSRRTAAVKAFKERFLRVGQSDGSWPNAVLAAAAAVPSRPAGRMIKLAGALVHAGTWRAAVHGAVRGFPPLNIWMHARKG